MWSRFVVLLGGSLYAAILQELMPSGTLELTLQPLKLAFFVDISGKIDLMENNMQPPVEEQKSDEPVFLLMRPPNGRAQGALDA